MQEMTQKNLYKSYFELNIHQKINERQHRNALNINNLFACVLRSCNYSKYKDYAHPKINNGIYHPIGKTHSKYPKN